MQKGQLGATWPIKLNQTRRLTSPLYASAPGSAGLWGLRGRGVTAPGRRAVRGAERLRFLYVWNHFIEIDKIKSYNSCYSHTSLI